MVLHLRHIGNISAIYQQYIGNISKNISFINISAIYRDKLQSIGTRSAGKFLKIASTSLKTWMIWALFSEMKCPRVPANLSGASLKYVAEDRTNGRKRSLFLLGVQIVNKAYKISTRMSSRNSVGADAWCHLL